MDIRQQAIIKAAQVLVQAWKGDRTDLTRKLNELSRAVEALAND